MQKSQTVAYCSPAGTLNGSATQERGDVSYPSHATYLALR